MKAVVEEYIYNEKGKKVKIVFDDIYKIRMHSQMLAAAYAYVLQKQEQKVK
jgi:hypothetical protein